MYAKKRYRAIIKVLCPLCLQMKSKGDLGIDCRSCTFIKYNNVNRLIGFADFVDKRFPDWVWVKIYEYHKDGRKGRELATYKNWYNTYMVVDGKTIKTGQTRDLPTRDYI